MLASPVAVALCRSQGRTGVRFGCVTAANAVVVAPAGVTVCVDAPASIVGTRGNLGDGLMSEQLRRGHCPRRPPSHMGAPRAWAAHRLGPSMSTQQYQHAPRAWEGGLHSWRVLHGGSERIAGIAGGATGQGAGAATLRAEGARARTRPWQNKQLLALALCAALARPKGGATAGRGRQTPLGRLSTVIDRLSAPDMAQDSCSLPPRCLSGPPPTLRLVSA